MREVSTAKPLLLIDVDGVISLFGFETSAPPPGSLALVDGIAHFLSASAGEYLRSLEEDYELVWCTGWEEKANEYLPLALGLAGPLPHLVLGDREPDGRRHWKLEAIDRFAGPERPLAWLDDVHDESCAEWASSRPGPTLLLTTEPAVGLTAEHVEELREWAARLA
jgi:hypothetical protein